MSEQYKQQMKACFEKADKSGDGTLSIQEVANVLKGCGCTLDDSQIAEIFLNDDTNQDSKITFDEFWASCKKRDPRDVTEEELRNEFNRLDTDKSGFLTASDLKSCLECKGISNEGLQEMIKACDKNGDGKVKFEEFLAMWKSQ